VPAALFVGKVSRMIEWLFAIILAAVSYGIGRDVGRTEGKGMMFLEYYHHIKDCDEACKEKNATIKIRGIGNV